MEDNVRKLGRSAFKGTKKLGKQSVGFYNSFLRFISRGNVVDLAVGVIIGAAFGAITTSLVNDIFTPLIVWATPGKSLVENFIVLRKNSTAPVPEYPTRLAAAAAGQITWNYGNFLQTIIYFFLVSFILFIIIELFEKLMRKKKEEKKTKDCPACGEKMKETALRCMHCTSCYSEAQLLRDEHEAKLAEANIKEISYPFNIVVPPANTTASAPSTALRKRPETPGANDDTAVLT